MEDRQGLSGWCGSDPGSSCLHPHSSRLPLPQFTSHPTSSDQAYVNTNRRPTFHHAATSQQETNSESSKKRQPRRATHYYSAPISKSSPDYQPGAIDLTAGRRFRPENVYPSADFGPDDIEMPVDDLVHLACPGFCPAHHDCIVIAIGGACSNNGKTWARSSTGVFYGKGNARNRGCALDGVERHTNQIAELDACVTALAHAIDIFLEWLKKGKRLSAVVIKSDSAYVVRGVVEWLPKWKANGWTNSRGLPVAIQKQFKVAESMIEFLKESDVIVKLWLVPREMNQKADRLAKLALKDGIPGDPIYYDQFKVIHG